VVPNLLGKSPDRPRLNVICDHQDISPVRRGTVGAADGFEVSGRRCYPQNAARRESQTKKTLRSANTGATG